MTTDARMRDYTEDILVRQMKVEYLGKDLGLESVYARNNEGFGLAGWSGRVNAGRRHE